MSIDPKSESEPKTNRASRRQPNSRPENVKPRSRGARLLRRGLGTMAILSGILAGLYAYQPQRYDFLPRQLPQYNPWIDPDSAKLFQAGTKVVVVTAHPDDAEFYLGGLLTRLGASGAQITLVVCTDGDKGYYPFEDWKRNRRVRQQEQRDAARVWNAQSVEFLSYPDGRLFANPDVVARIAKVIRRVQPEYVLAFDTEYPPRLSHRDHRNAGEATERAVQQTNGAKWLLRFSTIAPNFAVDVTSQWDAKRELLAIHKSQFSGEKLPRIEGFVQHSAEQYGRLLHVQYAEGLRCTRLP